MCRNDISFTLSSHNNQMYIVKNDGEHQYKTKKSVVWTHQGLSSLLREEEDKSLSVISFSILQRYVHSNKDYVRRSKIPQVNYLFPDCKNFELLCTSINKACENTDSPIKFHKLVE